MPSNSQLTKCFRCHFNGKLFATKKNHKNRVPFKKLNEMSIEKKNLNVFNARKKRMSNNNESAVKQQHRSQ